MSNNYTLAPSANSFRYPFGEIGERNYSLEEIFQRMPFQKTISYSDVGDFPNNISEYIFGKEGENDEESWQLLGKLNNDLYFWYDASCGYTGFDCQGGMVLFASTNLKYIVDYAMCRFEREALYSCISDIDPLNLQGMFSLQTIMK